MRQLRATGLTLVAAALLLALGACSDDDTHGHDPEILGTVTFHLDNTVDGDAVQFNQMIYTNARGSEYSISKLQYVVSNVLLHSTSGEVYGLGGVHFRDQADATTRSFTLTDIPAATYDRVSFTFGVNENDNIRDKFINSDPDFHTAMFWPSLLGADLGYHYMKLEGNFREHPDSADAGYTTHTGARQLDGNHPMFPGVSDPTPNHHFFNVVAPITATEIDGNAFEVSLRVDVNAWYTDHEPGNGYDSEYDWADLMMQMIMANLDAQKKLMTNGPGCFTASIAAVP